MVRSMDYSYVSKVHNFILELIIAEKSYYSVRKDIRLDSQQVRELKSSGMALFHFNEFFMLACLVA